MTANISDSIIDLHKCIFKSNQISRTTADICRIKLETNSREEIYSGFLNKRSKKTHQKKYLQSEFVEFKTKNNRSNY